MTVQAYRIVYGRMLAYRRSTGWFNFAA